MKNKILLLFVLFLMIIISMSISANAASYKNAYRKEVTKFEKQYRGKDYDKCLYDLIYIDKDKKPELICVAIKLMPDKQHNWYSYCKYYSFYSGKASCFHKGWSNPFSAHHSLPFYQPKINLFGFRCWDQGSISDVYWSIEKGKGSKTKTVSYGRTGDVNMPTLNSQYKWIEGKYTKSRVLKKLR